MNGLCGRFFQDDRINSCQWFHRFLPHILYFCALSSISRGYEALFSAGYKKGRIMNSLGGMCFVSKLNQLGSHGAHCSQMLTPKWQKYQHSCSLSCIQTRHAKPSCIVSKQTSFTVSFNGPTVCSSRSDRGYLQRLSIDRWHGRQIHFPLK